MRIHNLEELKPALERAYIEQAFWEDQADALRKDYPDQFVAIHQGCVIAAGPELETVIEQLKHRGLEIQDIWLRYIFGTLPAVGSLMGHPEPLRDLRESRGRQRLARAGLITPRWLPVRIAHVSDR